jgi:hypothetical protein
MRVSHFAYRSGAAFGAPKRSCGGDHSEMTPEDGICVAVLKDGAKVHCQFPGKLVRRATLSRRAGEGGGGDPHTPRPSFDTEESDGCGRQVAVVKDANGTREGEVPGTPRDLGQSDPAGGGDREV